MRSIDELSKEELRAELAAAQQRLVELTEQVARNDDKLRRSQKRELRAAEGPGGRTPRKLPTRIRECRHLRSGLRHSPPVDGQRYTGRGLSEPADG